MGAFSSSNTRARKSRFRLAEGALRTPEDGYVGAGVDVQSGEDYLIHTDIRGRSGAEAIALGACALAIGGGAIHADDVVGAYVEEGNLPALRAALAKYDAKQAPKAPRRKRAAPAKAPAKAPPESPVE